MLDRIAALLKKEFLQVFRDPRMKMVIFIAPLVQILIFGYAATMDITNVPTAIFDRDNTKESREIIRQFSYSKYFEIKKYISSEEEQKDIIDNSEVLAVIKFDRGFGRDVEGNKTAQVQLIVDGTDSNSAMIVTGYANQIISSYNSTILSERAAIFLKRSDVVPLVDLRDRRWFNENLESRNYYLPGVIALIVSIMSLLLSSMAVVREKEIGTMEQLIVSPLKPIELIIGKIVPFAIIALIQVILITLIGVLWFKVPMRGSIPLLLISTLIFLLTTLGAGLLISTVSATQQEAMMAVFLFFFPATLLSGFAYPIANMPTIIQYVTYLNPLRYYLIILRYVFLKGVGIRILWDEILALLIMGVGMIILSSTRFHKNLG
ncbi:MAG: ABC transporter permease [Candidatus Omnitrophica bacterium]|nr:ABC transporter permease [Candidatus Omnitrophota bacterium]MDD5436246.1 ABC transporter permease [Candidatus Omnitrophota bacterium]